MSIDSTLQNEIWKPIPGWESRYHVSNHGRFKSLAKLTSNNRQIKERILKESSTDRYKHVTLCMYGVSITYLSHVLVAEAFIGDCPEGMEVNHKDGNKHNNHLNNLEYMTHSENVKHAFREGLVKKQTPQS